MATVNDIIKNMLEKKDPKVTSSVVDVLRSNGLTYNDIKARAQKIDPTMDDAAFEDLMFAADEEGSHA